MRNSDESRLYHAVVGNYGHHASSGFRFMARDMRHAVVLAESECGPDDRLLEIEEVLPISNTVKGLTHEITCTCEAL